MEKCTFRRPLLFYKSLNYDVLEHYNKGFSLAELFTKYNSGIQTKNDSLTIKYTSDEVIKVVEAFKNLSTLELENFLKIKDSAGWKIDRAKDDILKNKGAVIDIQYRLFDTRKTYYTGKSSGFIGRTRGEVMESMKEANLALIFKRTGKVYGSTYDFLFVSKSVISEGLFAIDPLGREYLAPLYLYPETNTQQTIGQTAERTPNLNTDIVKHIAEKVGLTFTNEKEINKDTFSPIDILHYMYAILYSPTYREKYKEFLKIDFPRVPYPKDQVTFWQLVKLGGEIRQIHLLENPAVEKYITHYPIDGDNKVIKPKYESGKVCINDTQYFDNVPHIAWEFYIGGYQPAQKWLKDRKDRKLDFDDILHYQKIIVALSETDRLMKEIDAIEF
jgi:predicted helicase